MLRSILFTVLIIFLAREMNASPYYRFWRGWKLESMSYDEFSRALNGSLIPATFATGRGHGLIAYLPLLTHLPEVRPDDLKAALPDEIALVIYSSEEDYQALKATEPGKAYTDLHWTLFDKTRSKSAVPKQYTGTISANEAYEVLQSDANWQGGHVHFEISRVDQDPAPYIDKIKLLAVERGLLSFVILNAENYFIEIQLWADSATYESNAKWVQSKRSPYLRSIPKFSGEATKAPHDNALINCGQILNTQFSR